MWVRTEKILNKQEQGKLKCMVFIRAEQEKPKMALKPRCLNSLWNASLKV